MVRWPETLPLLVKQSVFGVYGIDGVVNEVQVKPLAAPNPWHCPVHAIAAISIVSPVSGSFAAANVTIREANDGRVPVFHGVLQ